MTFGVVREGSDAPREIIRVDSVRSRELEPEIGHIKINQFQQATPPSLFRKCSTVGREGFCAQPRSRAWCWTCATIPVGFSMQ